MAATAVWRWRPPSASVTVVSPGQWRRRGPDRASRAAGLLGGDGGWTARRRGRSRVGAAAAENWEPGGEGGDHAQGRA